jgi:hypothetical protein
MNQSIRQIINHILPLSYDNWLETVQKPLYSRPQYIMEEGILHIGQAAARFLGVPLDEDEYYNRLYDLVHQDIPGVLLISQDHLDKTIENKQFQSIQRVLNISKEQNLSVNRLTAFLDGEQLLLKSSNPAIHRKVREAFILMLNIFIEKEKNGLKSPDLQRVLVDVIKWSANHLGEVIEQINPDISMPKLIWYGNTKKSHQYFLSFLLYLGCDLLLFNPSGEDPFFLFDEEQHLTFVHKYPETHTPESFPEEKRNRKSTIAYRASREIETILNHDEESYFFKPWQLRDSTPSSVTLKTTYDELFLLAKEKAMIRPDFTVKNGKVKIPSIFAKIQGVSHNRKEYWERLHALTEMENSLLVKEFPLTRSINNDFRFHYRNAISREGELSTEKIIEANYWKYSQLPIGLQNGIATAIKNICAKPRLKALHHEKEEDVKIYLFTHGMQIPSEIVRMMQKFDYSQEVPKLILFNNGISGILSRSDAALLLLLNQFGFDLILYNPPGQNDIENYLNDKLYDTHWLEDLVFEQEYREPSPLRKFTISGFWKNLRGEQ